MNRRKKRKIKEAKEKVVFLFSVVFSFSFFSSFPSKFYLPFPVKTSEFESSYIVYPFFVNNPFFGTLTLVFVLYAPSKVLTVPPWKKVRKKKEGTERNDIKGKQKGEETKKKNKEQKRRSFDSHICFEDQKKKTKKWHRRKKDFGFSFFT